MSAGDIYPTMTRKAARKFLTVTTVDRSERIVAPIISVTDSKPKPPVRLAISTPPPPAPVDEDDQREDVQTHQQFWQRSLAPITRAMRLRWRHSGNVSLVNGEKFEVPSSLVTLAMQAIDAWTNLFQKLQHKRTPRADDDADDLGIRLSSTARRGSVMSGARYRRKGNRLERELVALHRALGVHAERQIGHLRNGQARPIEVHPATKGCPRMLDGDSVRALLPVYWTPSGNRP